MSIQPSNDSPCRFLTPAFYHRHTPSRAKPLPQPKQFLVKRSGKLRSPPVNTTETKPRHPVGLAARAVERHVLGPCPAALPHPAAQRSHLVFSGGNRPVRAWQADPGLLSNSRQQTRLFKETQSLVPMSTATGEIDSKQPDPTFPPLVGRSLEPR